MKIIQRLRLLQFGLLWLTSLAIPTAVSAALIDNFSYSNGSLTTVSGGAWQFWEPGAGDGTVVNGAFRYDGLTDVIRTFPSVLNAPGDVATIAFTINVNIANTTEGYAMDFLPASAPFGSANTNYGNQISVGFDYGTSATGFVSIEVAEGGSPQTFLVGTMTAGATHQIRFDLARGQSNTAYSLFLDNNLLRSGTFLLSDPRGLNAVEMEQSGASSPSATGFALIDNLSVVVPEPAGSTLLFLGSLALLASRRRKTSSEATATSRD